jgi:uncharacterized membrane protein HdeD (DUF308 family)
LLDRAPRRLAGLLGLVCVGLGLALLTRPLTSLSTLVLFVALSLLASGVADLLAARAAPAPRPAAAVGLGWVLAGAAVLAWPGLSVRLLAVVVGVALVGAGAVRGIGARHGGAPDARLAALLSGLASVVFGALALGWPDITLLVLAVLFGARTLWFGLTVLWEALPWRRPPAATPAAPAAAGAAGAPGALRRWASVLGAAAALGIALALTAVSAGLRAGAPVPDAFYTAPGPVPAPPGALLRREPFTRTVPPGARAWRILYTTTRDGATPALASALVVAPAAPPPGPRPVLAWAHGTTGFAPGCAPSLAPDPFGAGALFVLDRVVAEGWVLVATDYPGLGTAGPHPYLIGAGEGPSVLDSVRAARQLPDLALSPQTVVWGHSQGGHAALWTGILAPTYAPDVPLLGVAALAPASDLPGLTAHLPGVTGGSVFASYVVAAYTRTYPDLAFGASVRPTAQVLVREMAARCLTEPGAFVSVLAALSLTRDPELFAADPATGAFGRRLRENTPTGAIPAPVLLAQGLTDGLVDPAAQLRYVAARCAAGQAVDYRTYAGRDHVGVVRADSPLIPDLLGWTRDRLAGAAPASTCT